MLIKNNVNFKGVLVKNATKDEVIQNLLNAGFNNAKKFHYEENGDSVEISFNRDEIKAEVLKMKMPGDPADENWGVEANTAGFMEVIDSAVYMILNNFGFKCEITGEKSILTADVVDMLSDMFKIKR